MDAGPRSEQNRMQRLQNGLFSLNVAFAITSALFIYEGAHHLADAPKIIRECLESFAGTLSRIAPLAFHQHRKVNFVKSELIRGAVFLCLTSAIAVLSYFPIRLLVRPSAIQTVFLPLSGIAALIAVPVSWLYIVHATWSIYEPKSFGLSYGYAAVLELIVVGALVYLVRNQPIWWGAIVFAIHYISWMLMMLRHLSFPLVGVPLSLVFPASGIAWLRYVQALRSRKGV